MAARRIHLAHLPTPLWPCGIGRELGIDLWIKRDDMTAGAEAGNKIRKLEFLLAEALERGADTLITCGGLQSNHARATALLGASLGFASHLLLRTTTGDLDPARAPLRGNVLLNRLAGATLKLITPDDYRRRAELMEEVAEGLRKQGKTPYVIPEGGSNGLGALGYVEAMAEVRRQLDLGLADGKRFDVIVHACGSGGTTAGLALGAGKYDVADEVRAIAVCDDTATFVRTIGRLMAEAREIDPSLSSSAKLAIDDGFKGPGYAKAAPEQLATIRSVAKSTGLVLDPVYSGKAFHALIELSRRGTLAGKRVLFLHTGGLPGLLADGEAFAGELF